MPRIINKSFVAKAQTSETPGEFTALVSAFGNLDTQGDVIDQGAFTKTLAEWVIKARPIPVVWSHQWSDPDSFIGEYTAAEETPEGLLLTGVLDISDNPRAAQIYRLMKKGRIVEFSIGGAVRDWEIVHSEADNSSDFHILDMDLFEAGPCFKGANPDTELLSVKTDGQLGGLLANPLEIIRKEGRVLAQAHVNNLKSAHQQLGEVIAVVESQKTGPDSNASTKAEASADASILAPSVRALLELANVTNL